ncbi:MAG: hypothetical protein JXP34_18840, partial [Planctomycetes bacterium]|nr:hypothetical protein [Planctomycetota bacterium]
MRSKGRRGRGFLYAAGAVAAAAIAAWLGGCDSGGGGGDGGGIDRTPVKLKLTEDNAYYVTGDLVFPRYGHLSLTLRDGRVLVLGGSDERGLNTTDVVEIFDQILDIEPDPQSGLGGFVDTDYQGDPIRLPSGGRILFTATMLRTGDVVVLGGAADLLLSVPTPQIEIFDPFTRTFEVLAAEWRRGQENAARFGHTATLMPDGRIVIAGGQEVEVTTEVIPQPPPQQPIIRDITTFPAVRGFALFDPSDKAKGVQELLNSSGQQVLFTSRGRSGHAAQLIAGLNNTLGSSDDVLVIAGGYGTLSGASAPQAKIIGLDERDLMTAVEFYDHQLRTVARAGVTSERRANTPWLVNLGQHNSRTIDGVSGAANVVLLTHGDDDQFTTVTESEVYAVTFTGMGVGGGAVFLEVPSAAEGRVQDIEDIRSGITGDRIGRSGAPVIAVPRMMPTSDGERVATWVFTMGGVHLEGAGSLPGMRDGIVLATHIFDPYFNNNILGSPRDLTRSRTSGNPSGIVGTWLSADNEVPLTDSSVRWATATSLADLRMIPG